MQGRVAAPPGVLVAESRIEVVRGAVTDAATKLGPATIPCRWWWRQGRWRWRHELATTARTAHPGRVEVVVVSNSRSNSRAAHGMPSSRQWWNQSRRCRCRRKAPPVVPWEGGEEPRGAAAWASRACALHRRCPRRAAGTMVATLGSRSWSDRLAWRRFDSGRQCTCTRSVVVRRVAAEATARAPAAAGTSGTEGTCRATSRPCTLAGLAIHSSSRRCTGSWGFRTPGTHTLPQTAVVVPTAAVTMVAAWWR